MNLINKYQQLFPQKKRKQHPHNTKTGRLNVYINFRIAFLGIFAQFLSACH